MQKAVWKAAHSVGMLDDESVGKKVEQMESMLGYLLVDKLVEMRADTKVDMLVALKVGALAARKVAM